MKPNQIKNLMADAICLIDRESPLEHIPMTDVTKNASIITDSAGNVLSKGASEMLTPDLAVHSLSKTLSIFLKEITTLNMIATIDEYYTLFITHLPSNDLIMLCYGLGIRNFHYVFDTVLTARYYQYYDKLEIITKQHFVSDLPVEWRRSLGRM